MLICNGLTRMECAVLNYFSVQKSKEMHYSGPCGGTMTKREIVYSSSRQDALHIPISSGWEIGWKINETQSRRTSEPQKQDVGVVAQSWAG